MLKTDFKPVSSGTSDTEFPVDIDGDTPDVLISSAEPFLVSSDSLSTPQSKDLTAAIPKEAEARRPSAAGSPPQTLLGDNSAVFPRKLFPQIEDIPEPYEQPFDSGLLNGTTAEQEISTLLSSASYLKYDGDIDFNSRTSVSRGNGNGDHKDRGDPTDTSPIPEPATVLLLGTGLVGLLGMRIGSKLKK